MTTWSCWIQESLLRLEYGTAVWGLVHVQTFLWHTGSRVHQHYGLHVNLICLASRHAMACFACSLTVINELVAGCRGPLSLAHWCVHAAVVASSVGF